MKDTKKEINDKELEKASGGMKIIIGQTKAKIVEFIKNIIDKQRNR